MDNKKQISLRIPAIEMKILEEYLEKTGRSKTDVIREFIRTLKER